MASKEFSDVKDHLADAADAAREVVEGHVDEAQKRVHRFSDGVQEKYRKISDDVRDGAERARRELSRSARVARERFDETAEGARRTYAKVRSNLSDVSDQVSTYVRDNPGKSVLIAAAAGFLVGLVVRRSRDED
ncbi:MAG TPA: hypothetical protein VN783_06265 [Thermoanaerobaculia bacterium]|nr:hypothetical protein [Thermoanaerobaculia bacterium]